MTEPRLDSPPASRRSESPGPSTFATRPPVALPPRPADSGAADAFRPRLSSIPQRTERQKRKAALESLLALSAEEYVELAFEAANASTSMFEEEDDDKTMAAAKEFDTKHIEHSTACRGHLVSLEYTPADILEQRSYNRRLKDLRRNRYFIRESVSVAKGIKAKRRRKPRWRLETSCWAERAKSGNAAPDFFETSDALRRMFDVDWGIASRAHELSWYILKCQADPSEWRNLNKDSAHDEVEEVKEVLWQHHRLLYGAFDYYAALYSDMENAPGEPDIFNISFPAFMNFCEHNEFVSKRVPPGEFEVIWAIVNAKDRKLSAEEDKFNKASALNRQEFMQTLVRCAIAVYVKRGAIGDVSDSVTQLCVGNLLPSMQRRCPSALQNSNAFRTRFCYVEPTSVVLEANLSSLRALYDLYAEVAQHTGDALRDDALMSIGEWLTFVKQMGLISARQLTIVQAKNVFLWSRIRSVTGVGDKAEIRLRHLFFEDFLEALVRLATMMAFPTNVEIEDVGASNAGEFLISLQAEDPQLYSEFLDSHRPQHKDADGSDFDADGTGLKALFQPVHLTLKHLIHLLVRTVEHNTSALKNDEAADGVIQTAEAAKFIKMRSEGKDLTMKQSIVGADWRLAQDKAVFTAAAIKIQLASRARKAKEKVAAQKRLNAETQQALDADEKGAQVGDDK